MRLTYWFTMLALGAGFCLTARAVCQGQYWSGLLTFIYLAAMLLLTADKMARES